MNKFRCNGVAGLLCWPEEVAALVKLCGCFLTPEQEQHLTQAYADGEHEPVHFEPFVVEDESSTTVTISENREGGWQYHVRVEFHAGDDLPSALRVLAHCVGETEDTLFSGPYELSGSFDEEGDNNTWAPVFEGSILHAMLFLLANAEE